MLPVPLTTDELLARGQRLAQLQRELAAHAAKESSVKKELGKEKARLESEICVFSNVIADKAEYREVEVQSEQKNKRTVLEVRSDSGEVLRDRAIREDELQEELPLKEKDANPPE